MLDYVVIQIWTCTRTRTSESTAWNLNSWFGQRNWSLSYRRIVLRPVAPTRHTKAKGLWLAMNITEHDDGFVQCMTLSVNWTLNLKLKRCPSTDDWNFFARITMASGVKTERSSRDTKGDQVIRTLDVIARKSTRTEWEPYHKQISTFWFR